MKVLRSFLKVAAVMTVLSVCHCSATGDDASSGETSGASGSGDDIADLSGIYDCSSGCDSDDCEFGSGITVTQSGDAITFVGLTGTMQGIVGDDSTFAVENEEALCEGQCSESGVLVTCSVNCSTFDGVVCQTATFRRR